MINDEDVIWAYRLLLGREPENQEVITEAKFNFYNRANLVKFIMSSSEYKDKNIHVIPQNRFWHFSASYRARKLLTILRSIFLHKNFTSIGPYQGHRLTSIDQLDLALNRAAEARNVSEHDFLQSLGSFYFDLVPSNSDPFSNEYKLHWYEVYERLAGRPYVVANEFFDFDVPSHTERPYPFVPKTFV